MGTSGYDVVVVGGGPAGLGAALVLGRARRRVAVVDAGAPRNAPAAHMQGYLSRDGMPPANFLAAGRAEVAGYGVELIHDQVVAAECGFVIRLAGGAVLAARRLLIATGARDELPDIPGARERWGRDLLHCPYCHGWEVRDQPLGVLGTQPGAAQHALLVRQWSADVIFFAHTGGLSSTERVQLIPAGALGDRIGRKGVLLTGLGVFAVGCLTSAAAATVTVLVAGRVVSGAGAALVTAGHSWTSALVIGSFTAAALLLAAFIVHALRAARPLLDPRVFAIAGLRAGALGVGCVFFGLFALFYVNAQYLQYVRGYQPFTTGLAILPLPIGIIVISRRSIALARRVGVRTVVASGMALLAAGLAALSLVSSATPYPPFGLALLAISTGMGLSVPTLSAGIMTSLPPARAGLG